MAGWFRLESYFAVFCLVCVWGVGVLLLPLSYFISMRQSLLELGAQCFSVRLLTSKRQWSSCLSPQDRGYRPMWHAGLAVAMGTRELGSSPYLLNHFLSPAQNVLNDCSQVGTGAGTR